jgi:hypothetical protein
VPRKRSVSVVVVLGGVLSACSGSQSQNEPPPAPDPPLARTVPIDGNYNGLMQLASGTTDACGSQDVFTLQVRNNAFSYVLNQPQVPWRPSVTFAVTIEQDGSFHATSGAAHIDGTVAQGHMQGQIVGDSCGFQFEADNSGSF